MRRLLERERERATIVGLINESAAGDGRVLLVDGPAGIGKTALLDETRGLGDDAEMTVLAAQGDELELDFGYGVVRQLFEGFVAGLNADQRGEVLSGAAGLAATVVVPDGVATTPIDGDRASAIPHGLYWLTANLAARQPLMIVVDDVQWCDLPSLRFLVYLARRLDGLPAAIVLAARTGEPGLDADLWQKLASEPAAARLKPAPLSAEAIGELVASGLGATDGPFAQACHEATAGNPFLAGELISALRQAAVPPTVHGATQIQALGSGGVARAVLSRLGRMSPAAVALARALAVLGDRSELRVAAALAGLETRVAAEALDSLVAIELLAPEPRWGFQHPIVRASIYADLAPAARSNAHRLAAELLAQDAVDPEQIAAHLLRSDPGGDRFTVAWLRAAAASALEHGAPEIAAGYLRRALDEPPPVPDRAQVLHELGGAETGARDPNAVEHLHEALRLSDDPGERARVAHDLVPLLVLGGRWEAGVELIASILAELGEREPELRMRFEWMRAAGAVYDPRLAGQVADELPRLRALAQDGAKAARGIALVVAAVSAMRTGNVDDVIRFVRIGLDSGRLLTDEGPGSLSLPQAVGALIYVDRLDDADELVEAILEEARRRGSALGLVSGLTNRGLARLQRGALMSAEADLLGALALAQEYDFVFAIPTILRYLGDSLLERAGLEDVRAFVDGLDLEPAFMSTYSGALLVDLRARLALADGDRPAAIAGLRQCCRVQDAIGVSNAIPFAVRSTLALALGPDRRAEASRLVAEELEQARATGLPRARGVALRASGKLAGGELGIERLREAVVVLEGAPSPLERARARVELGSALRRAGERRAARDELRQGLDLARACGASRLAERAEDELRTAGARPRRLAFSGIDALTASERRIAELAAHAMSNQQIAESLFVTAKTVENHLGRVYQKLGIHSRHELATRLRSDGTTGVRR